MAEIKEMSLEEFNAEAARQNSEAANPEFKQTVSRVPYKKEELPELYKLLKNPKTTPAIVNEWFTNKGYQVPGNTSQILSYYKKNPNAPLNSAMTVTETIHQDRAAKKGFDVTDAFDASIKDQGGWGLSPETRAFLGDTGDGDSFAGDGAIGRGVEILTDAPANIADLGYRGLQALQGGVDTALQGVDYLSDISGAADALSSGGSPFHPGAAVRALAEAFPSGADDLIMRPRPGNPASAAAEASPTTAKTGKKTVDTARNEEILRSKGLTESHFKTPEEADAAVAKIKQENPALAEDPVKKLSRVLKGAGKASEEQIKLTADFRKDQAAKLKAAREKGAGEGGLNIEAASLKGSAPKADFEAVKEQFTQPEVDNLFETVKNSPSFANSDFSSFNARVGLRKLLEGEIPTKSELDLLKQALPADVIKTALSKRGSKAKLADFLGEAINLPRSVMATLDLSAPLRQGIFTIGRKEFYTALPSMFKEFVHAFKKNDETPAKPGVNFQSSGSLVYDEIRQRPSYDLMEQSGLEITDMHSTSLSKREEDFMTNWAEKAPGFGVLAKASNSAYTGFLNKLRADMFDDMAKKAQDLGLSFEANPKDFQDMAKYINSATGRGDLTIMGNDWLKKSAPLLNATFFSPRLIKSRVDTLNPAFYASLSPVARKEAVKDLLKFGAIASSVLALAVMNGAEVETDPRSSSFGKIKDGGTRYDVLGGYGQYITLGARLYDNQKKTGKGDIVPLDGVAFNGTRGSVLKDFARNKLAPVPAYLVNYLTGSNAIGEEFSAGGDAAKMMIPLFLQSVADAYEEEGMTGIVKASPGLFGIGVSTYETPVDRFGRTVTSNEETDPTVVALEELTGEKGLGDLLGYADAGDLKKFDATPEQLLEYQKLSGELILQSTKELMETKEWEGMDEDSRKATIKGMLPQLRKAAKAHLFPEHYSLDSKEKSKPTEPEIEDGVVEASTFAEGAILSVFPNARTTSTHRDENHPLSKKARELGYISEHEGFDVVDIAPIPGVTFSEFIDKLESQGIKVIRSKTLNETGKGKSKAATGDHWHVFIDTSNLVSE